MTSVSNTVACYRDSHPLLDERQPPPTVAVPRATTVSVHEPLRADLNTLLIGGFGMRMAHLEKYRQLYVGLGVDMTTAITPSVLTMTIPARCEAYATRLAEGLERVPGAIRLHLFSGAVWIYYALNALASPQLRDRIVSVVFESTPLDSRAEQFGRFLAWRCGRSYQPWWALPFHPYRSAVGISQRWEAQNRRRMTNLPEHLRVLCIYSSADQVADARYIEAYIAALRLRKLRVTWLRLTNGRHCLAMRDDRQAYLSALTDSLPRN